MRSSLPTVLNGQPLDDSGISPETDDRAFRYGDGCFETFRAHHGNPLFFKGHWKRLLHTTAFLQLQLPAYFSEDYLIGQIGMLCGQLTTGHARMRLQVWRSGGGKYAPETDKASWMLQAEELPYGHFELNDTGLRLGVFRELPVNPLPISGHKTLNALPYVLGARFARSQQWDDALMLDAGGHIAETTSSNIFLVRNKEIVTPTLSAGGLPGTMRSVLLALAEDAGYSVRAATVSDREMHWADECLLTNAVRGISWVLAYGKKRYFHRHADALVAKLNNAAGITQLSRGSSGRLTM